MGTVHVDTPVLDAMAESVDDVLERTASLPYVALTHECFETVRAETEAMRDAIARYDSDHWVMELPTPRAFFGYDLVVVDDLPEGVDWEWRTHDH